MLMDFSPFDFKPRRGIQVSDNNPLVGLEGRIALMHELAKWLPSNPTILLVGGAADCLTTASTAMKH